MKKKMKVSFLVCEQGDEKINIFILFDQLRSLPVITYFALLWQCLDFILHIATMM